MHFHNCADQWVKTPLHVQKFVQVNFVTVLNVLVVKLAVSEDVVHVVFGAPPFKTESSCQACCDSAVFHEPRMAVVGHWVTDPAWNHLSESEKQNAYNCAFSRACDHHCAEQCDRQCGFAIPERLEEMMNFFVHLVVFNWVFGRLSFWNNGERLENFLCLFGMKTSGF